MIQDKNRKEKEVVTAINQQIDAYTEKNIYDFDNKIVLQYYPKRIIEKMGKCEELSLLELGLGHGYSAVEFQDKVMRHTILDGDKTVIDRFIKKYGKHHMNIIHTFFENYETNEKYDFIVAGFVLEHVENPLFILQKYKMMLKDEGRMFVVVPNAESLNRRIGYEAGMLSNILQLSDTDRAFGHKRYYTEESVRAVCELAGLQIKSVEGVYLKPLTTKQMMSLNFDESVLQSFCVVGRKYPELCTAILLECVL